MLGYFHVTVAELRGCSGDHLAHNAYSFYSLALFRTVCRQPGYMILFLGDRSKPTS